VAGLLGVPASFAWAQQAGRTYRIGGITPVPRTAAHWVVLFDELKRDGFVEGINLTVTGFEIAPDRLDAAAAEMVARGIDVILSGGLAPTRAVQRATATVPILTAVDDFVAQGFVQSLARPGGNITGVSVLGPELNGKRQEILLELVPDAVRLGALVDPASSSQSEIDRLVADANARRVSLNVYRAGRLEEIGPAIETAGRERVQALNVLASQFFNVNRAEILGNIARVGLPAIYQWPEWVREGGLLAYGPRFTTVYRQVARQVTQVLRGASPSNLPVEQPTTFDLAFNGRAAKALGLVIPASLLARADEVIE